MIQRPSGRVSSRRAWLQAAGVTACIVGLPARLAGAATGKDDTMHDIMHLVRIHTPADRVYQAITSADGIRAWWTQDATIGSQVGDTGEFGFYARRFVAQVTITELAPPTTIRWTVANAAWPGHEIAFHLKPDGDDTVLVFAHRGFPRADEAFASATTRWGYYLLSLKQYLQTGKGRPNPLDSEVLG